MNAPKSKKNYQAPITIYFLLVSLLILFMMGYTLLLQTKSSKYSEIKERVLKQKKVSSTRGTIYASDGFPLAKTVMRYDVAIDPGVWRAKDYDSGEAVALADSLQALLFESAGITAQEYLKIFKSGTRYVPIEKNVSIEMLRRMERFPILEKKNRYRSGFIKKRKHYRVYPLGMAGRRTVGSMQDSSGLEGAYNELLSGRYGVSKQQLIFKKTERGYRSLWKPINQDIVGVHHGSDITVSIDTYIQRATHRELERYLIKHKSRYGVAIVMESRTGNILALSSLVSNADRTRFYDQLNYAVGWKALEPGSIFKIFSAICLLESGKVDTNTTINTAPGYWTLHGITIRDDNKSLGRIDLKTAFEKSSNVAFSKWIYKFFRRNPYEFIDRLHQMGIGNRDYKVSDLPGSLSARLPDPSSKEWSLVSLPYLSFGYEVLMTPLELITFGNAIANNGIIVRPRFLIKRGTPFGTKGEMEPVRRLGVLCSKQTLGKLQRMMEGVVLRGTAKGLKKAPMRIAGKTSTTQIDRGRSGKVNHGGAFLGYFPAQNPKYTVYVYIDDPKDRYYGADVAAPVVKELTKYLAHLCLNHISQTR